MQRDFEAAPMHHECEEIASVASGPFGVELVGGVTGSFLKSDQLEVFLLEKTKQLRQHYRFKTADMQQHDVLDVAAE